MVRREDTPLDSKCIQDCPMEPRIKALEDWKSESKKFHNTFYDWQKEQIARDARLDVQLGGIEENLKKLVSWQDAQRDKPAKRLDSITEKIVLCLVAAVVGYILAQVGLT